MTTPGNPLRQLIERHCETLRDSVAALGTHLAVVWPENPSSSDAARTAADIAHQLAGAGGSIGFHDVTASARALEAELQTLIDGNPSGEDQRVRIVAAFGELVTVANGLRPEASALYDAHLGPPGGASGPARMAGQGRSG